MLSIRNLHAYYGKSHVLQGVDFEVERGRIVALIGRNGVGRTTTLRAIIGDITATGSIRLDDRDLIGLPTHAIARLGIGYVPEHRDVFPDLTVRQNLLLGVKAGSGGERSWTVDDVMVRFPRLAERADVSAGALSGGEQQMLTICRCLVGNPSIVLIDEPTEGLAPMIVDQVAQLLVEVAARGAGILLIEQKLAIALKISTRIHVMGRGEIVFSGSPAELQARADIRDTWLTA